jgi:hypothetical protein
MPTAPVSDRASGIYGQSRARYIPPELWDDGITAGLLNYNFTGNNVHNDIGGSSNYAYLNLQSGLNLGAWRLRDNTTWSYSSGGSKQRESMAARQQLAGGTSRPALAPDARRQLYQRRRVRRHQLPRRPAGLRRQYAAGQPEGFAR